MRYFSFFLLIIAFSGAINANEELKLPELGDSATTALSPEQSRQIGAEMVRRMRQGGYIISDPLITSYVEQMGRSLSVYTDTNQKFSFFVVDAPSINAFALPGGYIGIHSGLIVASRNESELAGVVAHEIAHVTQHHLARSVEHANRMQLPLTIAVLAAILLGGGDPDVANAAIAASLGGSEQMRLNFTRSHEHEADRIGIQLLARSEYNPRGMAGFFSRLLEESRFYGQGVPEFLSTHPVTTTRLAEAQSAAERYPYVMRADSTAYQVAKAKLTLHHSKNASKLLEQVRVSGGKTPDAYSLYLQAITYSALRQNDKAEGLLKRLVAQQPDSIAYRDTLGQLYFSQQRYSAASSLYTNGLQRYPYNETLSLSLSKLHIAEKRYPQAREVLQELIRRNPLLSSAYPLLAQVETASGNKASAHLTQAKYYLLLDDPHSAQEQLNIAKGIKDLDFYHTTRIEALDQEIRESIERVQSVH